MMRECMVVCVARLCCYSHISREFCMCRIAGAWAPDFLELEEKAARIWSGSGFNRVVGGGSGGEGLVGNKYTYRLNRAYA